MAKGSPTEIKKISVNLHKKTEMMDVGKENNIVKYTVIMLKCLNIEFLIKSLNKIFFLSNHQPFFPLTGIITDGNNISGLKS